MWREVLPVKLKKKKKTTDLTVLTFYPTLKNVGVSIKHPKPTKTNLTAHTSGFKCVHF